MREQAEGGPEAGPRSAPSSAPRAVTESDIPAPVSAPDAFPDCVGRSSYELRDYHAAFNVARTAMALVDPDGRLLAANPAFGSLLGADRVRLTACRAADLLGICTDGPTQDSYREVLGGSRARLRCTRRLNHPDGRALWAEVTVAALNSGAPGALVSVEDVTERRELASRLRHLQMHDPVTRRPNRALFFQR